MSKISLLLLKSQIFIAVFLFGSVNSLFGQETPTVNLELIADHLVAPVAAASPNDGTDRLFVAEERGVLLIIKDKKVVQEPFLDLTDKIVKLMPFYDERGLLGIAFHPNYKSNGRFFVYYSAEGVNCNECNHQGVIAEYRVSENNPDKASTSGRILLTFDEPEMNHNGGQLAFGPEGYLYIGLGDGGGAGDEHGERGNGQNLNTFLGKILRIDVDKDQPYSVPGDNPFVGKDAKSEIWAYGLRNPWKFSFDHNTGELFCGDVGQDKYEEVDIIRKGGNYGWRIMEGLHCYNPSNCDSKNLILPVNEYSHKTGNCVIGGYIYRGTSIPSLDGKFIFGDWSGLLFYMEKVNNILWFRHTIKIANAREENLGMNINGFAEDGGGEIYILAQRTIGPKNSTGEIYKIIP